MQEAEQRERCVAFQCVGTFGTDVTESFVLADGALALSLAARRSKQNNKPDFQPCELRTNSETSSTEMSNSTKVSSNVSEQSPGFLPMYCLIYTLSDQKVKMKVKIQESNFSVDQCTKNSKHAFKFGGGL